MLLLLLLFFLQYLLHFLHLLLLEQSSSVLKRNVCNRDISSTQSNTTNSANKEKETVHVIGYYNENRLITEEHIQQVNIQEYLSSIPNWHYEVLEVRKDMVPS